MGSRCLICIVVLAQDLDAVAGYLDGYYRSTYSMTSKERALLRQALSALEYHTELTRPIHRTNEAVIALREALASCRLTTTEQAEQEPVAWVGLTKEELHQIEMTCETSAECYRVIAKALKDRNYAAPVQQVDLDKICAAIKAEDDYCVDQGDYMLDSNDCIKIVRGEWVRPDFDIAADREKNK